MSLFLINPKKLILIDFVGALFSAFLLGVVLVKFESTFGIPKNTLYLLAFFPCLFAFYDFYMLIRNQRNFRFYLKVIAYANIVYCFLSAGLAIYHYQSITFFGLGYISIEILIILVIVSLEIKASQKFKS